MRGKNKGGKGGETILGIQGDGGGGGREGRGIKKGVENGRREGDIGK